MIVTIGEDMGMNFSEKPQVKSSASLGRQHDRSATVAI